MSSQRCVVCGFQNPAGSAFCENCGRQLPDPQGAMPVDGPPPTVPVAGRSAPQPAPWTPGARPPQYPGAGSPSGFPTPPTGVSPPPGAPPASRPSPPPQAFSPYYHPGGMPPPVSRTSPGLIVGIAALALVALVVVSLAGFLVVRRLASIPQAANPGGSAPVSTPRGGPSPVPTTGPTAPPQGGGAGGAVTTKSFSLDPGGFQVTKHTDAEVDLQGSAGGVAVAAGQPDSPTTTQQELSHIQQQLESQYGSLQTCVDPQTFTIGGKSGTLQGWLYTDTDSSGNQVQVCDAYWVDAPRNGNLYEYEQLGDNSTWNSELEPAAQPVRDSIQWLV